MSDLLSSSSLAGVVPKGLTLVRIVSLFEKAGTMGDSYFSDHFLYNDTLFAFRGLEISSSLSVNHFLEYLVAFVFRAHFPFPAEYIATFRNQRLLHHYRKFGKSQPRNLWEGNQKCVGFGDAKFSTAFTLLSISSAVQI